MENQASDLMQAVIGELIKGREIGKQLLELVRHHGTNNIGDEGSLLIPFAQDLVKNILRSFTNTLLLLNTNYDFDSHEILMSACPKSEEEDDVDESYKSLSTRNGRGCYKRKRAMQTLEKESPILVDDGQAWRKYGQKMTMNAKYLRYYYRCSHKYDQDCPAMKQVQRIQEKPPLYRSTYFGLHTCKNQLLPGMALDTSSPSDSSLLLSFNNNSLPEKQVHPFSSSSSTKKEESISNHHHIDVKQNLASQYEHVTVLSSTSDLFSSVKVESIEVDDVILRCFDFDESVRFGL